MKRREFIKFMVAGTGVAFVPSVFNGCSTKPLVAMEGWNGPLPEETDIRIQVLSYAILAPNPNNIQPWLIDLTGPRSFDLYVDPERLLPETDPPYRQIHIGQGTFLENADLAARYYGYRADIRYFPRGMYGNTVLEKKPVASVELVEDPAVRVDPLFASILDRQSNRKVYDDTPLNQAELNGLNSAFDAAEYPLTVTTDPALRAKLAEIAKEAMRIEVGNRARDMEIAANFRFNDEEMEQHRDGFGVAQSGITGFKKWMIETFFLSRESAEAPDSTFGENVISLTQDQAHSAIGFGWITSTANTRRHQVQAGQAYERVNLTATRLGLAMQPMTQVLQEYPDMAELQQSFHRVLRIPQGHTVQMFFRLGSADSYVHSPRRRLKNLMKG